MTHQELLRYFHSQYPDLVREMRQADHAYNKDNLSIYHLEGTVFEHSMLVLHEAVRRNYPFEVQLAALLHDIGKPASIKKVDEKQKTTFYNHESMSIMLALTIMKDLNLDYSSKVRLVTAIGYHTEVFKKPLNELLELIKDIPTYNLLMMLAECDHNGRFYDNSFEKSYPSLNEYTNKAKIFYKDKLVTLTVGLPASGKSTYANKYHSYSYRVSRDSLIEQVEGDNYNEKWKNADQKQIDKDLQLMFQQAKKEKDVVVDMTHMSTKSRRRTLSHFDDTYEKHCIVFLPTLDTLIKNMESRPEKVVDESVLDVMINAFRPPILGEGFDQIRYIFT